MSGDRAVIERGDIWWAQLPESGGSEPDYRRPVLILQSDDFNRSRIQTVVAAVFTTNLRLAAAPGNVLVPAQDSGLPKDSVINVSQIITVDESFLIELVGQVKERMMTQVEDGVRLVLAL